MDFSSPAIPPPSAASEHFKDRKAESSGEESDLIHLRVQAKVFLMKSVPVTAAAEESKEAADPSTATNGDEAAKGTEAGDAAAKPSAAAPAEGAKQQDKWVDVGLGELHINSYKAADGSTKGRLIMRADRTHRLILNSPILPHLAQSFMVHEQRYVRLASVSVEEGGGKLQQLLLKVKGKPEATEIVAALQKVVALIDDRGGKGE